MRRILALAWVLSLAVTAEAQMGEDPVAQGEAPEELDQAARLLFEAGTRAYSEGRFAEALQRYQTAYNLSQRPELLYNIAVCFDRLEEKESAVDAYRAFLDALPASSRAPLARSRLDIIEEVMTRARSGRSGHSTAREGSTDTSEPTPTEHPGRAGERAAGSSSPITPSLAQQATVPAASTPSSSERAEAGAAQRESGRPEPARSGDGLRAGAGIALGVSGAGVLTWVVAGLIARSRFKKAENTCHDGHCDAAELGGIARPALLADIGLGVAAAGALTALVLKLAGRSEQEDASHVTVEAGAGSALITLRGRF